MKLLDQLFAWVMIALGIVHSAAAFVLVKTFNTGAVWFFAAGIAMIATGMLDVLRVRGNMPMLHAFSTVTNVLVLGVMTALVFLSLHRITHSPQVIVGLVAAGFETLFSLGRRG